MTEKKISEVVEDVVEEAQEAAEVIIEKKPNPFVRAGRWIKNHAVQVGIGLGTAALAAGGLVLMKTLGGGEDPLPDLPVEVPDISGGDFEA